MNKLIELPRNLRTACSRTGTATKEIEALEIEAKELAAMEVPVEHNSGTFGAAECCRATGSGDPKHGEYTVYARVGDGQRRAQPTAAALCLGVQ